ncbi:AMP-binding protein [Propionivibrio sp.]|uniref:AMP-binding protein n=1 Tax=Propionivibrio sp. TaxID=2212460 RepID=UPI003BF13E25
MRPDPRDASIRSLLEYRAACDPQATFMLAPENGCRLSFAELLQSSRHLAAFLDSHGIAPGAHVSMVLPNGLQAVRTFVGTMAAARVVVPLSLIAQVGQLAYVIEHSDCVAVFVAVEFEARLRAALAKLSRPVMVFVVDPDVVGMGEEKALTAWPETEPVAEDTALLMYTSGTTGLPKGVLLSHNNVLSGARFVSAVHGLGGSDRVLAVLPLYHINAQIVTVLAPLYHGGSLVMPRRFSKQAFWSLAEEHRCTWLNVVPTIIAFLLGECTESADASIPALDHSRLRFCRSASAPLPPAHQQAFEERFGVPVVETMGLTETAAPVFANFSDMERRKIASPGQAYGNEARVIDAATGLELPSGSPGEIIVRGPNVTSGYYKSPDETRRAFTADGWLRTGDLGCRDEDGFYFITGRLKELIIKGGENIAPREIDEVLLQHPAVLEAAAVGVPDALYGQEILVGIVLRPGAHCGEVNLMEFCRERLGAFKTPRYLRFMSELPKGPSGKVQRNRLLES